MALNKWRMIWNIPKLAKKSWALFQNPGTPVSRKLFIVLLALGYFLWPIDFIPDIPLIGQIDDLAVIFLLLNWFVNRSDTTVSANTAHKTGKNEDIETEYYFKDERDQDKY